MAAPISLHLSLFSNLHGSKLLIKIDEIELVECIELVELDIDDEIEEDVDVNVEDCPSKRLLVRFDGELFPFNDVLVDGGAEQIAFSNFNIPSSMRISKSILLFNSSF